MEDSLKSTLKELKQNESTISMLLGSLVVIIVGVLLYNYFTAKTPQITQESTTDTQEQAAESNTTNTLPTTHTVQEGEHLWSIAEQYYDSGYNWIDIAETNGLGDGDLLAVGSVISIPDVEARIPGQEVRPRVISQPVEVSATIEGEGYVVQAGDTLWSIAVRTYQDGYQWPRLYDANSDIISNPSSLEVGMNLRLPQIEPVSNTPVE